MARLAGVIVSDDEIFRKQVTNVLRSGPVPVSVSEDRHPKEAGPAPDVLIVDGRGDAQMSMTTIERLRISAPTATIVNIALQAQPELIIQAMRAGANEFFTWPLPEDAFHEALRRMAARRDSTADGRPRASTLVFFGAKGGAGTTTVAVNCGVELARLSKRATVIVDLKPGLGEVSLFLGVRSRYTLLDAIDNLHRLDGDFLRELLGKHKSGLEILAGSEQFERPGANDNAAVDEVFRLLTQKYDYILIDAGSQMTSCAATALYAADTICLVANPDVPSVRNAQRLLDRIEQLGVAGERVRVLLNRAAEPYPIPPAQIEAALGRPIDHTFPSDYRTVSTALNSGVPLALTGATDIAAQFDAFTRRILDPEAQTPPPGGRRSTLGLERLASLW
jgi:pilus assembly protein CpaE